MCPVSRAVTIGEYQVLKRLGKGSSGTVFLAVRLGTDAKVAIKVLPGKMINDPARRMRFAKECQLARGLDHPHIVRVLDYGLDGYTPFLVMEYLSGGSLGQRLSKRGRLREGEAVQIVTQIGQALQWAHEHCLIHRDVKPDNIILGGNKAKLSDLGLIKDQKDKERITADLECLGTPSFMAPEQFKDARKADARSDLYSLAATLYMAVTGAMPFRGRNPGDLPGIYKKKLDREIAPPRQLVPELSVRVSAAILQALEPDRQKRQRSVREFVESLTERCITIQNNEPGRGALTVSVPALMGERRAARRANSRQPTRCNRLQQPSAVPWTGKVLNIARTGICLQLNRRFERGVLLTVRLDAGPQITHSAVASVVWVKTISSSTWRIGCRFAQPLSEAEVLALT